jgi:hypothetical protein
MFIFAAEINYKTKMTGTQLHIKLANCINPMEDYTISGVCAAVE